MSEIRANKIPIVDVEDEEEVPPESGTDGKDKDNKEEAEKEKQDEPEKNTAEEKKTEEADGKSDPKVRAHFWGAGCDLNTQGCFN